METVDLEHNRLYDHIAGSNLDGATSILKQHISNIKKHAIDSINKLMLVNRTHSL
ncbi:MAG: hypothetical protein V1793_25965 [Pseudomonadota bacterium]